MTIEEAREYWNRRLERAKNYSDDHWDAEERHAHADYVDAMIYAITALTVCIEHKKPKSNGDRIRQMTDEEIAEMLLLSTCYFGCNKCKYNGKCMGKSCTEAALEWLKQEAESNDR